MTGCQVCCFILDSCGVKIHMQLCYSCRHMQASYARHLTPQIYVVLRMKTPVERVQTRLSSKRSASVLKDVRQC